MGWTGPENPKGNPDQMENRLMGPDSMRGRVLHQRWRGLQHSLKKAHPRSQLWRSPSRIWRCCCWMSHLGH